MTASGGFADFFTASEPPELWSAKRGSGAEPALSAAEGTVKDLKMRCIC
jgi:hypothetical protein